MIIFIVLIVVISLIIYYLFKRKQKEREKFGDAISVKKTPEILDWKQQFGDMIVYDNDADGRIGLDKCIEKCKGYCVEFGQTGSAYCFPDRKEPVKDFGGMILPNEKQLTYPNVSR